MKKFTPAAHHRTFSTSTGVRSQFLPLRNPFIAKLHLGCVRTHFESQRAQLLLSTKTYLGSLQSKCVLSGPRRG
ncbi:unnamed protein product, partial [Mesorhabditis belari]|uniref:Uncharacterized protein n=1 Tax=Mesorhabditis belari TaxID=2138241 RepID=A0AAF3ET40_9BILA